MLIRQEQSQLRPVQGLRETPDPRFENLSQNSDEQEEAIQPYSAIRNRAPTPNSRQGGNFPQERMHQSMKEHESIIPKIWQEELLHEENDTALAQALVEECGPLTLMVYHRLLQLSQEFYEFKQLNGIFLSGASCLQKKR